MVNKNQSKVSTLRSKLVAAIAMLLVGAFMVVSSSYAWFTLSTAPEVTGIYTSVGANGNLEMALLPNDGLAAIQNGVGTTGNNEAWGNLVDLGQTVDGQTKYGLDKIQLLPARLDIADNGDEATYKYKIVDATVGAGLLAPTYGADGRVDSLVPTVFGKYNAATKTFDRVTSANGVVAIGTASGMTLQQSYWLQAKKAVNQHLTTAQNYADKSFETKVYTIEAVTDETTGAVKTPARDVSAGEMLANVIMSKAINGDNAKADLRFVPIMVGQLKLASGELKLAMNNYLMALASFALQSKTSEEWKAALDTINALNIDNIQTKAAEGETPSYQYIMVGTEEIKVSADSNFMYVYNKYNKINTIIDFVEGKMATYGENIPTEATWGEASAILFTNAITDDNTSKFVDYNEVTLNGYTPKRLNDEIIKNNATSSNKELVAFGMDFLKSGVVDFTSNSGVHADFAEVVGEYQSEINLSISSESVGLDVEAENVKLRAVKDADVAGVNLYDKLQNQPSSSGGDTSANPITDMYGYRLDFGFRTNAAGSSLMLQTTPVDRIYSDNTDANSETMGHGSTMTFEILEGATFTQAQAKKLMTGVRIVFIDGAGNIIAVGVLNQNPTTDTYGSTANGGIISPITLYKPAFVADGTQYKFDLANSTPVSDVTKDSEDNVIAQAIMDLTQNEATQLSTLVYLDGDVVDNSMVPADAIYALKGSLNLQFSSSADLKPMDYTQFKGTSNNNTTTEAATESVTEAQG